MKGTSTRSLARRFLLGVSLAAATGLTGCQVDVGGQTLPSGYYLKDDVQYYAPGPQFKLSREAAAMKAAQTETAQPLPPPPPPQ